MKPKKTPLMKYSNATDDRNSSLLLGMAYISQPHFGETSMEEAAKRFGNIDTLTNNGKTTTGPISVSDSCVKTKSNLQQTPYSVMEEHEFANPKKGIYFRIKAAVKRMVNRTIKNCYSINGHILVPRMLTHDSTHALKRVFGVDTYVDSISNIETLTKTIALELEDKGMRYKRTYPGFAYTTQIKRLRKMKQKK